MERKQRKQQMSMRLSKHTLLQIEQLSNLLDVSYTDVMSIAIDRLHVSTVAKTPKLETREDLLILPRG